MRAISCFTAFSFLNFRARCLGFWVWGLGFGGWGSGFEFGVWDVGFGNWGCVEVGGLDQDDGHGQGCFSVGMHGRGKERVKVGRERGRKAEKAMREKEGMTVSIRMLSSTIPGFKI
jgi:hypothetical protein